MLVGYYPPDHSIVTGGPNNLDSFEALLYVPSMLPSYISTFAPTLIFSFQRLSRELADLLGQVKPPTVSKDEIDKSGLEIIKAAQLSQHENDGKVSSNCLDRVCIIYIYIFTFSV